ncbi:tyrosine-type recombinase/integrase [Candidatus Woesearchaeota archaeon]|jgi:integrase/recombinase XerD|nr:tyrosine-type recombinase/integrase [Candidatus Woesearchaeota archaeon]
MNSINEIENLIIQECKLRGYSQKTITSYLYHTKKFIESKKTLRKYLLSLIEKNKSNETIRSSGFAIKFYLKIINKNSSSTNNILSNLPNVKREKKLPVILSKEEIEQLILATKNINHRLIIQISYSAGLRISEIINLKWEDIDFSRNIIHIKKAKGKKDRIVMLSKKVKCELQKLTSDKTCHVFITNRIKKYTSRTIQKIIENVAKKTNITKKITPHTLRHSFATHLLEQGTDIRYIRDLLGHSNISTTLIYTKVSNKNLAKIKSPLD